MYINEKVEVIINPSNFKHYKKFYNEISNKDNITVKIDELTKGSKAKINIKCDECGIEKNIAYVLYLRYGYKNGDYLCKKCKLKKNNQKKYGVDNVFELKEIQKKIKKTIRDKYGVDNISLSKEIQEKKQETYKKRTEYQTEIINKKRVNTNLKIYGVKNISELLEIKNLKQEKWNKKNKNELLEIKNKRIITLFNKYGVKHTSEIEEIKTQQIKTYKINTGQRFLNKNNDFIKIKNNGLTGICHICQSEFYITKELYNSRKSRNITYCTKCLPFKSSISGLELQLQNFIRENYDKTIIKNSRKIINPYELDIYLPNLNLAFEFNGIYWHNELNKPKNYHLMKSDLCKKQEIQLIHIWEDDWNFKQDIVKSMILNKLNLNQEKIMARKCEIREITDNKLIRKFLDENHLQGFVGSSIKLGLFYKNELVSIILFKKTKNDYELSRFVNKLNSNVIGGASKLFKYFIKNYNFDKILTFSNNSYSNGNLYKILNFKKTKKILPDYSCVIDGKRIHKFNFRKNRLKKYFNIENKTEHQICLENGIFRIYDSGKIKWIFNI